MEQERASPASKSSEEVRISNYLATELAVAKYRWLIIGFLLIYNNALKPPAWPVALFNGILAGAAAYNLAIYFYIRKVRTFSTRLTLTFLYGDLLAVAGGMYFTGGVDSPFFFIWYLTLFTSGIRFGFLKSLTVQIPMMMFLTFFLYRTAAAGDREFLDGLILGLFSISAVAQFGSIFSHEEKSTMKSLEEFRTESITDRLTGLYNYAFFLDELQREEARSVRSGSHFGLLIFDLDHFKVINDTYGHEKGNVLLRAVADILKSSARKMDVVARYGGEEFAILMPEIDAVSTETAERIRIKIEETEFSGVAKKPIRITISAGVAIYPMDASSAMDLLDCADKGLYLAKNSGRNRVCRSGESERPPLE